MAKKPAAAIAQAAGVAVDIAVDSVIPGDVVGDVAGAMASAAVRGVAELINVFPTKPRKRDPVSVGIERVRRGDVLNEARALTVDAFTAGDASDLFGRAGKTGGAAFAQWVAEQGIAEGARKSRAEWEPLLSAFADRAIFGHRRTAEGGNHRPNRQHLR